MVYMENMRDAYVRWMDEFLTREEKIELLTNYLKDLRSKQRGVAQVIKALEKNN